MHEIQVGLVEVWDLVRQLEVILNTFFNAYRYFGLEELVVLLLLYLVLGQDCIEKHYLDGFELFVSEQMVFY